ncbi:DUF1223 domain-containing protein [Rubellicoccus peritrichatus]|uniref:DUF1223 domain-containing protein n=1 Tax=Rubellicoccus peritrichatus TaxID=3080537 RepID=A0AAQ3LAA9_9BACT|nr:DUF1223 domain-containing protein [Puniceicoccus sp. CR14]WOO41726.1 DUF1223 domain-containing protein [Puniceicoccus sp. CR14]
MKLKAFSILTVILIASNLPIRAAEPVTFDSGEQQVALVELFTSQGCSSCPPAERWINQLEGDSRLWTGVVPVVWHVDYWDRLGWKDPYANSENTERQYAYRRTDAINSVYTPGFVVDGKEWRGFFQRKGLKLPSTKADGRLTATLKGNQLTADFSGHAKGPLVLNIAVLGIDLETKVARGENRGRLLNQSFTVLEHQTGQSSDGKWELTIPQGAINDSERQALAIWVSRKGSQKPIQATGGWLSEAASSAKG